MPVSVRAARVLLVGIGLLASVVAYFAATLVNLGMADGMDLAEAVIAVAPLVVAAVALGAASLAAAVGIGRRRRWGWALGIAVGVIGALTCVVYFLLVSTDLVVGVPVAAFAFIAIALVRGAAPFAKIRTE
jgi:hypothetical protein